MPINKMTDEQAYSLAAASDLLREYGYESVADVVGRISEQEQVIQYGSGNVRRVPFPVVEFDRLVDAAKQLVDSTGGDTAIKRAVLDLVCSFRPGERSKVAVDKRDACH